LKRLFDLTFCLAGLVLLSPVFILLSLAIWLNDFGPVFFRQKRVGRKGAIFSMYKFRSMKVMKAAEDGLFEPGVSTRITPLGKFIRRTKLDELPQLFNVLKGEMSLVGPRPEVEKWVTVYPEKWKIILSIKPGITDNASIKFRSEEELLRKSADPESTFRDQILPVKTDLYLDYVNNHTFAGDIKILFNTILTVFKQ
jgi:lipopolysaccharide/colanic/teichoic acid biosynthesis glycosyltransferase